MKEKNDLRSIAEWENNKPPLATFNEVNFKLGKVTKVVGLYNGSSCHWDGFGFAYHPSGKRFKNADINFKTID